MLQKKKNLLFLTRKYPPIKGGMEQYSYDFYNNIKDLVDTRLYANTKGNKNLFYFFIKSKIFLAFNSRKFKNIHLGDGLLAPLGIIIRLFSKAKMTITIHALDILYKNPVYQLIIPYCVKKFDKVVCVSNFTIDECLKRGIPKEKCFFIPNGIDFENLETIQTPKEKAIEQLEKKHRIKLKGKKILFSIGRLVKRKGNEFFVREVMPKLDDSYLYVIAGSGEEESNIRKAINEKGLKGKVILVGRISDEDKILFFKSSDWFIMPNIKVEGDAEGFGITLIEASAYRLPCIATKMEGIKDAVIEGKTGWLVEPSADKSKTASDFVKKINQKILISDKNYREFREIYSWKEIAKEYKKQIFS